MAILGLKGVTFSDSTTQNTASQYNMQVFTVGSGTWTKPANLKGIKITLVSGGGTGGAGAAPFGFSVPQGKGAVSWGVVGGSGGGGGGGGTAIHHLSVSEITTNTVPYTVGAAAGASSFGPWAPANPAATMTITAGASGVTRANGGSGGSVSGTADTKIKGGGGSSGGASALSYTVYGGTGGDSAAGGGGISDTAGGNYGAGGGGGLTNSVGAAGSAGVMIIEEFY